MVASAETGSPLPGGGLPDRFHHVVDIHGIHAARTPAQGVAKKKPRVMPIFMKSGYLLK